MSKNCLSCKTRIKADSDTWDNNNGDFWHCQAVVPVQRYGVMWIENRHKNPTDPKSVGRLINLNLFRKEHVHYKSGVDGDCALWSSENV